MSTSIDDLLAGDSADWVQALPEFQRSTIGELVAGGSSFDDVAQAWLNAAATNTYRFSAGAPVSGKSTFLENLKDEIRGFLCGDKKYSKERDGLFGQRNGLARSAVVSTMAVAIAPYLGVAAPVIAPLIALVMASIGKIVLSAWCTSPSAAAPSPAPAP